MIPIPLVALLYLLLYRFWIKYSLEVSAVASLLATVIYLLLMSLFNIPGY